MPETFKLISANTLEIRTPETVVEKVEIISKDELIARRDMLVKRLARVDELLAQFKVVK